MTIPVILYNTVLMYEMVMSGSKIKSLSFYLPVQRPQILQLFIYNLAL